MQEYDYAPDEIFHPPVLKKIHKLIPSFVWRFFISKDKREMAWLGYYHGLYQTRDPSSEMFAWMLHKYGTFDFTTPFREASSSWYAFHPDNIFLADVNYVLDCWQSRQFGAKKPVATRNLPDDDNQSASPSVKEMMDDIHEAWRDMYSHRPSENTYRSIFDTERDNESARHLKMEAWEREGLLSLSALFLSPRSNWDWMDKWMHVDNLKILIHILLRDENGLSSGVRRGLLQNFKNAGWLSRADVAYLERSLV